MISCILKGGLGNQLFQIATTIILAVENRCAFAFDEATFPPRGGASGEIFQAGAPSKYRDNFYRKLPFKTITNNNFLVYSERNFHYEPIPAHDGLLLNGYFQSEKYFINSEEIIRKVFAPPQDIKDDFERLYGNIENLVSLHVRRGSHAKNHHYHGACDAEYFLSAVNSFDEETNFLVFSDDQEWCKKTFSGPRFIFAQPAEDYEDLYHMSFCKHNIICNSTFSWWAAWLNNNPNKRVICPQKWFGPGYAHNKLDDLMPNKWEQIKNNLIGIE